VPVIAGAVAAVVQFDTAQLVILVLYALDEDNLGAMPAEQGEVDAVCRGAGTEREGSAARESESEHSCFERGKGDRQKIGRRRAPDKPEAW